jgi:hypothetical protein
VKASTQISLNILRCLFNRRQSIFLDQFINFDQENARIIETTELIKMTQEVVQIGRRQEKAFETYIPKSVPTITLDINKMSEFCKKTVKQSKVCPARDWLT